MQLPDRKKKIKILNNEYEIEFPKNRQLIEISRYKMDISGGHQGKMLFGGEVDQMSYLLIEAIATFSVLIPKLEEDMMVKSLLDLDPMQSKSLLKGYEAYYAWFKEWTKVINEEESESEKK